MKYGKYVVPKDRSRLDPWHSHFRIYRNEFNGCKGWNVTLGLNGSRLNRYFADSAYGSPELSLKAAQEFAHKDRELHLEYLALRRRLKPRTNSKSGIPGVARFSCKTRGDFWAAYFDDPVSRTRKMKRFMVSQFGEEPAKELAIEFRKESMEPYAKRYLQLEREIFGNEAAQASCFSSQHVA